MIGTVLAISLSANRAASAAGERTALVIGNSNYQDLGVLKNADSDARAVAAIVRNMGYNTKLVTDATEQGLRREIRQFASITANADIAFIFYAGHAAQVGGSNYLLPVDMEVPRFETDIALEGIKVDDLVNSLRARTKVVFIDACRDNPALYKNLVKGRGANTVGLAPANTSSLEATPPGGGVFIAYAADAGSVAADGTGAHSPFTEALLKDLAKPISIDDMFTLVTREVRLVTNNAQRPYKYASLESIVCLAGECTGAAPAATLDVVQQAKRSEAEDFQVALQAKSTKALQAYLDKYPDSSRRDEAVNALSLMRRSQFHEWAIFEMNEADRPFFIQLGSIETYGDRVALREKYSENSLPAPKDRPTFPEGADEEDLIVVDCKQPSYAASESEVFSKSGDLLWRYKWAEPKLLDLSFQIVPGSIMATLRNIACHDELRTPLVDREELIAATLTSLASTATGDGEVYYFPGRPLKLASDNMQGRPKPDWQETLAMQRFYQDKKFDDVVGYFRNVPGGSPLYRAEVSLLYIRCATSQVFVAKREIYDASQHLLGVFVADPYRVAWSDIGPTGALALLRKTVCLSDKEVK